MYLLGGVGVLVLEGGTILKKAPLWEANFPLMMKQRINYYLNP